MPNIDRKAAALQAKAERLEREAARLKEEAKQRIEAHMEALTKKKEEIEGGGQG